MLYEKYKFYFNDDLSRMLNTKTKHLDDPLGNTMPAATAFGWGNTGSDRQHLESQNF